MLVFAACAGFLEAQTAAGEEALLSAVGTLSGATAYTTFMAMGTAADSYANKVYAADKAVGIMGVLRTLARTAARGLDTLLETDALHQGDRAYVRGMLAAYGHLVAEADGFDTWVRTGERNGYDQARVRAWQAIADTLALGAPGADVPVPESEALE